MITPFLIDQIIFLSPLLMLEMLKQSLNFISASLPVRTMLAYFQNLSKLKYSAGKEKK